MKNLRIISLIVLVFFTVACGYYLAVSSLFVSNSGLQSNLIPTSDGEFKLFLLENIKTRKIIIDAGSNSQFGIDSLMIERATRLPTINISTNTTTSLKDKLLLIKANANPGDIVILPLEWIYYNREYDTDEYFKYFFTRYAHIFRALPFKERVRKVMSMPVSFPLEEFRARAGRDTLDAGIMERYNTFEEKALKVRLSLNGDNIFTGKKPELEESSRLRGCFDYTIGHKRLMDRKRALKLFLPYVLLMQQLEQGGLQVFIAWPSVAGKGCYSQHKGLFATFVLEFKELFSEHGIGVLGEPEDSSFGEQYIFNSHFHLNRQGRTIRTRRLVEALLPLIEPGGPGPYVSAVELARSAIERNIKSNLAKRQ